MSLVIGHRTIASATSVRVSQSLAGRRVRVSHPNARSTTQDWQSLVHRALTAKIPAPRIAQLTGLDPQDIVQAAGG
ncbi:hypothetical protein C1I97_06700 [Streptomyces sp. NTH33]|uniref:DUF6003 family protein n=1 Tax=Streptomyces sp. NTH33 TaxID=1735453 RepID=UPI000DA7AAEE|nr:hypothetical protein C1I97_06700 [Streptomyces sp. NTH33]